MIFEHTSKERGMWRGWLKNGQSLEITWWRTPVGMRFGQHGRSKHIWIGLGFIQAFIPRGIDQNGEDFLGDEPDWGLDLSKEFGIVWHWGRKRKSWDWPFHTVLLAWEYESLTGSWVNMDDRPTDPENWDRRPGAKRESYPFRYTLRSGRVQERSATIIQERWTRGRHILSRLGWPPRVKYAIDVEFDGEVGEREGSWKGGTIGCGYDMLPGETPLQTLRRMERERTFS